MRVLHFYKTYFPDTFGGVECVIRNIANGIEKFGVKTNVLSLSRQQNLEPISIDSHTLHRAHLDLHLASTGFSYSVISKFKSLAKEADIIHFHFPWPFMDLVHFLSQKSFKKPTVVTYHSDIVNQKFLIQFYKPLQSTFLKSVDKIIATSPQYIESSPVLKKYTHKTEVIPIGLDKSTYQTSEKTLNAWREKLPQKFFLFIGVLRYYKGLHILLEAAAQNQYPIVIAGSGPLEQTLKDQAKQLNLKNVYFVGKVLDEDKTALLQLCYGFVFPSHLRSEAFGISLLEAAMFAKPMISTEIQTGTSYINLHEKTGLVIQPNNSIELHKSMEWLWEHPKEAQNMGEQAQARYQNLFTTEHMAKGYFDIYKNIL